MPTKDLTDKQKRFCEEYLIDLNATRAYKRAGYKVNSDDAACTAGLRLLGNDRVAAYISELQAARSRRTQITADRVLQEWARIAYSDLTEVMSFSNEGSVLADSSRLPKRVRAAIESITYVETIKPDGTVTVKKSAKMHNKIAALNALSEHIGIFKHDASKDDEPTTGIVWERLADDDAEDIANGDTEG